MSKVLMLLICYLGGPGTPDQARPVVDKFLRQLEQASGWPKGSAQGVYRATLPTCQAAMDQSQPNLLAVDLPAYLGQHQRWKLTPLAHMGPADKKRYHLLVRKGSGIKDLAGLKGKTLVSTLADDPRFLSNIVFAGKVDAAKQLTLIKTRRPLKGIREVARGRADATVVDELAFAHLKELSLPAPLESIFESAAVPDLTLAAVGGRSSAKLVGEIRKALPRLCVGAGEQLCRTFQISAFTRAKPGLYQQLARRYGQ